MKNEYGVKLDSNKYAPSVLKTEQGSCYICRRQIETVRHEIFCGTSYRQKSKRLGAWVYLCPKCHKRVHDKESMYYYELKWIGEKALMEHYSWDVDEFRQNFGKNYCED